MLKILNRIWEKDNIILLTFASVKLLIHLYTNIFAGYGYFRDELYYLACSEHLSFGYVDQPPFSIGLLALWRFIAGDSIFALRFLPALAGAITVFLTGLIARELGGKRSAQVLASLAALVSLSNIAMSVIYSMNVFEFLFWTLGFYLLIRIIKSPSPKQWIYFGLLIGIAALNKISIFWFGAGVAVGFVLTEHRQTLKTPYPYLAAVIALFLFSPYIIWNLLNDFATLEFIRNASQYKYSTNNALTFLAGQLTHQNPITVPLWMSGLFFLLLAKVMKQFKILVVVFLTALFILLINGHSKPEYLSASYSVLFAGGAVGMERWLTGKWKILKPVYGGLMIIGGIFLAPIVLPILPVETYIKYADAAGVSPSSNEGKRLDKLPQFYADMFGWEEKVQAIAKAFQSLTPEEQKKCAIYADNYGRCAAVDFWSSKYGLPKSIGRHNNYWIWGPGNCNGEIIITIGGDYRYKQGEFEQVMIVDTVRSQYCIPYENNLPVFICRGLKIPVQDAWNRIKHYD